MSKDKQIEEMAQDICKGRRNCAKCTAYPDACKAVEYAERYYTAGYRKADEVSREIFEEIEQEIKNHGICYAQRKIAELKKKYTESEKDDG